MDDDLDLDYRYKVHKLWKKRKTDFFFISARKSAKYYKLNGLLGRRLPRASFLQYLFRS